MWNHQATQRNIEQLRADGTHILGPAYGVVASGDSGVGRMVEPAEILEGLSREFDRKRDLVGQRVVVSAGPTVEDLDPVRFLSNRSSGKMGFALAAAAAARGATVDLVAGPVSLPTPQGVQRHDVRSALEMLQKLRALLADPCAALFMAAAVGDYRAEAPQTKKIKRDGAMALKLAENPDLIATIAAELRRNPPAEAAGKSGSPLLVAFALETGTDAEVVRAATQKRAKKGVDYVVANSVAEALGGDDNRVTLVGPAHPEPWPTLTKRQVADRLLTALLVPVQGAQVLHGECPL
jgi:phosphopantothenoylcysteine decarboxylase/phosphopantothenate--cysteine ligase